MLRLLTATVLLAAVPSGTAGARQTNAERMSELAVRCVAPRAEGLDAIRLDGPSRLPFVRSAVVASWTAGGVTVYDAARADSAGVADVHLDVESAGVTYGRAGGDRIARTVSLALLVRVVEPDGRIRSDAACRDTLTDEVSRDALASLGNPAYPETIGQGPPAGWFRRILQPAVVTAATAVGVFLFFSLRSRRSDDGG